MTRKLRTPSLFELEAEARPLARSPGPFARVALNRPVQREFTYAVPEGLRARVALGTRVMVPFGPRRTLGVIVALDEESDLSAGRLKELLMVLDEEPVVGAELLGLTRWIAQRYACSWGEALAAVLPAPLKRERSRRKLPRIQARAGIGQVELDELRARHPEQHRLLRTLLDVGAPMPLRDLLRSLQLSESPAKTLRKRGWVEIDFVEEEADPLATSTSPRTRPERLSAGQERALARVVAALDAGGGRTFLLHGVTGSGKTEVYLRAIEHARTQGRAAIVLVPEIALTPQTVGWFRSRFGEVCVLHSRMSDAQRLSEWKRLQQGRVRVVVGARSAVFAPLANIGVIVVDEEHEPSFKQESVPRYLARDVAVERARRAGAVCLLGSATPSLESWFRARSGEYELVQLAERVGGGSASQVQVVDLRIEGECARDRPLFSRLLLTYLAETLEHGEQAILFLNRRGYVPVLWCPGCSSTLACVQCTTALTYHRRIDRLVCHSCCKERDLPPACPTCSRPGLSTFGIGSERVERDLVRAFPRARVRRMDSDTMRRREDYEACLSAFERGEVDVLVGTQMIAKGLDFPRVTLVGIVLADQAMHLPDFRSGERAFQLIAQVSGRAGRGSLPGRVVVQTLRPADPAVRFGASADYEGYARSESAHRALFGYPPHGRLVRAVFEDEDEERARVAAVVAAEELHALAGRGEGAGVPEVLGPGVAPFGLLRGRHRHQVALKVPLGDPLFERGVARLVELAARDGRPAVKIDVDPMSML